MATTRETQGQESEIHNLTKRVEMLERYMADFHPKACAATQDAKAVQKSKAVLKGIKTLLIPDYADPDMYHGPGFSVKIHMD